MTDATKRKTLIFILLAVVVTVLIAAALPQLQLQPGIPIPHRLEDYATPNEEPRSFLSISMAVKAILVTIAVFSVIYVSYKVIKGVPWIETLGALALIAVLTGLAFLILFLLAGVEIAPIPEPASKNLLPEAEIDSPPFVDLPLGLIWLVWIGLAAVIILLGVWLIKWRAKPARVSDPVTMELEQAMHALEMGMDLKNVILCCYRQMSLAMQKERGIELEQTMTAHEFEGLLQARGIPFEPVHQLTQLFETVRYGLHQPDPADERKAYDCLNAIVQYGQAGRSPS
jgi:hypothetical protein